jgi:hypothetical protein
MSQESNTETNTIKVTWCFKDTEFDYLQYEEARVNAGLPKTLSIELFDEDEDEIESYLFENFGFEAAKWEYVD